MSELGGKGKISGSIAVGLASLLLCVGNEFEIPLGLLEGESVSQHWAGPGPHRSCFSRIMEITV